MHKITKPYFDLTFDHLEALCRFCRPTSDSQEVRLRELWRSTLDNQARFLRQASDSALALMEFNRTLLTDQLEKVGRDTENLASQLAHTTARAMAIATQARRENHDRRVFYLPLPDPSERRAAILNDRRNGTNGQHFQA